MVEIGRDVGFPHWVFGESCFAFLDGGRVAFRFTRGTGSTASPCGKPTGR